MSNEMTAEEYLKQSKECNDSLSVFQTSVMVHYGDLRAKEAVKELHSFARSQAIEFIDWQRSDECPYVSVDDERWRNMYNNFDIITTPELYSQFLAHQAKQKEGGKI